MYSNLPRWVMFVGERHLAYSLVSLKKFCAYSSKRKQPDDAELAGQREVGVRAKYLTCHVGFCASPSALLFGDSLHPKEFDSSK